jgi:hypothetical protein
MLLHIDAPSAEGYPFRLQPKALLEGGISGELDGAARTHYPLPRQID